MGGRVCRQGWDGRTDGRAGWRGWYGHTNGRTGRRGRWADRQTDRQSYIIATKIFNLHRIDFQYHEDSIDSFLNERIVVSNFVRVFLHRVLRDSLHGYSVHVRGCCLTFQRNERLTKSFLSNVGVLSSIFIFFLKLFLITFFGIISSVISYTFILYYFLCDTCSGILNNEEHSKIRFYDFRKSCFLLSDFDGFPSSWN